MSAFDQRVQILYRRLRAMNPDADYSDLVFRAIKGVELIDAQGTGFLGYEHIDTFRELNKDAA